MKVNLNNTDNNDYVRGYKDGKKAGIEQAQRMEPPPMTLNDKLSEEMQDRINNDAKAAFPIPVKFSDQIACMERREGYIAVATAENERAQNLADALEWIKTYGPVDSLTVRFIDKALGQFKDGKGKESDKLYRPCPHCGKELFRDRNLCCRACGKEVGDESDISLCNKCGRSTNNNIGLPERNYHLCDECMQEPEHL